MLDRDDVRGKWAGPRGPKGSDILMVGMAPGKQELVEGSAFVGPTGRVSAVCLGGAGIDPATCRYINVVNCYPLGPKDKVLPEQAIACRGRFEEELRTSGARIVVPLGAEALLAVTGAKGRKQGIGAWRGYVMTEDLMVPVRYATKKTRKTFPPVLPPATKYILPSLHPAFIMRTGFTKLPYLQCDMMRVKRAQLGRLRTLDVEATATTLEEIAFSGPWDIASVDIEAPKDPNTGEYTDRIERIGVTVQDARGRMMSASEPWDERTRNLTKLIVEQLGILVLAFNIMYDARKLELDEVMLGGNWWDPMWGHQFLWPDLEKSLNSVASCYLDIPRWKHLRPPEPKYKQPRLRRKKKESEAEFNVRLLAAQAVQLDLFVAEVQAKATGEREYNLKDSFYLPPIYKGQVEVMKRTNQYDLFVNTIMPTIPTLIRMQARGLRVDPVVRDDMTRKYTIQRDAARRVWDRKTGGVDAGSWQELHKYLYTDLGLPRQFAEEDRRGEETKRSVTANKEAILDLLELELPKDVEISLKALLAWRKYGKRVGTYLGMGDFVHPSYGPVGKDEGERGQKFTFSAGTGRLTARNPGLQAWEKPLRRLFIPHRDDYQFLALDWVQQEARIQAFMAQDRALMDAVMSGDIHAYHMEVFGLTRHRLGRTLAKNAVYGGIFRAGPRAIQKQFKAQGHRVELAEIKAVLDEVTRRYRKTREWQERYIQQVMARQYAVNPFGRRRYFYLPRYQGRVEAKSNVINQICNFPVQSSGADMLWRVLRPLDEESRKMWGSLAAAIHDETLFEVPGGVVGRATKRLRAIMEQPFPEIGDGFFCPVEPKVGRNWAKQAMGNQQGLVVLAA